eukprot:GHUV01047854.1.p1 GENE.GHUV01047854.1~~GHUV01047854.1.p1  ORF type:complete len:144 (+),score=17.40 GHUV01047854.1:204-635(+)
MITKLIGVQLVPSVICQGQNDRDKQSGLTNRAVDSGAGASITNCSIYKITGETVSEVSILISILLIEAQLDSVAPDTHPFRSTNSQFCSQLTHPRIDTTHSQLSSQLTHAQPTHPTADSIDNWLNAQLTQLSPESTVLVSSLR